MPWALSLSPSGMKVMFQTLGIAGLLPELWIDGRLILSQRVPRAELSLLWFSHCFFLLLGRSSGPGSWLELTDDGNISLAMSLGRLLRRASSRASDLLTLTAGGSCSLLDGDIIYSKNNVCVHPPELLQGTGEHHPGDGETLPVLSFLSPVKCYTLGSKK